MRPLWQRILYRAGAIGVVAGIMAFLLVWAEIKIAEVTFAGNVLPAAQPSLSGPLLFGLVGFAVGALIECTRRPKA
jgi:hypothetical protein